MGDKNAFGQLIKNYEKKMFKFAYGYFPDSDEAMEIVQDTFVKVYQNLDNFKLGSSFNSWIYKICSNLCIDRFRKNKRENQNFKKLQSKFNEDSGMNPEKSVEFESQNEHIKRAVNQLPQQQKKVFLLKYFSYKKFREIADIMGIAVGSVKSLHFRALAKVRREIHLLEGNYERL